jgi:hypothetical protein
MHDFLPRRSGCRDGDPLVLVQDSEEAATAVLPRLASTPKMLLLPKSSNIGAISAAIAFASDDVFSN